MQREIFLVPSTIHNKLGANLIGPFGGIPHQTMNNASRRKPIECKVFAQGGTSQTGPGSANNKLKTRGSYKTFYTTMAKPNSRYSNFKYNSRLSHRVSYSTLAKVIPTTSSSRENIPVLGNEI
jgi:hypothetical protein